MFSQLTSPNETQRNEMKWKNHQQQQQQGTICIWNEKRMRVNKWTENWKWNVSCCCCGFFSLRSPWNVIILCEKIVCMKWIDLRANGFDLIGFEWIWQFLKHYYTLAKSHAQTHLAGIEITCVFWQNLILLGIVKFVRMYDDQSFVRSYTQTAKSLAI